MSGAESEADVSPQVVQALEASGCILYRNNRGVAKYGKQWVRYGVGPNGAGDFIGFLPVLVTKEMVGQFIAVFVSAETKGTVGNTSPERLANQIKWRNTILAAGGIAGLCNSWEQGRALVIDWFKRFNACKKKGKRLRK